MKTHTFSKLREQVLSDPERRALYEQYYKAQADAIRLAELRQRRVGSQQEMASRLATSQARISQIERAEDIYLSTLDRYVQALGGRLKIVAEFPDETVTLRHE